MAAQTQWQAAFFIVLARHDSAEAISSCPPCHCEERDSSLTLGTGSAISAGLVRMEIATHLSIARNDTPSMSLRGWRNQPKQSRWGQ